MFLSTIAGINLSDPQTVKVIITLATFAATIVAFMFSKVRSDIIALCSTAMLLATGVIDSKEALAGFSNSAVIMMVGLFVVGGAVFSILQAQTRSACFSSLCSSPLSWPPS